jgi:hypothetical protein
VVRALDHNPLNEAPVSKAMWDCGDVSFGSAGCLECMVLGEQSIDVFGRSFERLLSVILRCGPLGGMLFSRRIEAPGIACGAIASAKNDDVATLFDTRGRCRARAQRARPLRYHTQRSDSRLRASPPPIAPRQCSKATSSTFIFASLAG